MWRSHISKARMRGLQEQINQLEHILIRVAALILTTIAIVKLIITEILS